MTSIQYIKTYQLQVREWCASVLADEGLEALLPNITVHHQFRMEWLAHQFTMRLRAPVKVLQDDTVVAEWPKSLWDYIKRAIGLKYSKEQLRMNECLVYPNVAIPDLGKFGENIRLAVEPRITYIPHPYIEE